MEYFVYKITCNSPNIDHVYVGSTEDLEERIRKHKYHSNRERCTSKVYTTIREQGGFSNWTLEVVEIGTVETKFEIRSRERYYYDQLRPSLNTYRPQASSEEIRIDKRERDKQNRSQKVHCETCNCEIRKSNMARHLKNNQHLKNLELNKHASKN